MATNERMCIACRKKSNKSALLRIVKTKESEVFISSGNKCFGRGAYICKSEKCIKNAQKRGALSRAFKMHVEDKIYEEIINAIGDDINE